MILQFIYSKPNMKRAYIVIPDLHRKLNAYFVGTVVTAILKMDLMPDYVRWGHCTTKPHL